MRLLVTPLTFLEFAVFLVAVVAFALAVRFFIASQKGLQHLLPNRQKRRAYFGIAMDSDGFLVPAGQQRKQPTTEKNTEAMGTKKEIKELREMLHRQQKDLTRLLLQVQSFAADKGREPAAAKPVSTQQNQWQRVDEQTLEIEELRWQLEKKEAELKRLQGGDADSKPQAVEEDSVEDEWADDDPEAEEELRQTAELMMKIEQLERVASDAEETVQKKDGKIRDLATEAARLKEELNEANDRLEEAALLRQQLLKKVQYLEEVNADLQQLSEAARKLKAESRRVAELESMLNMVTQERDSLLKHR